MVDWLSSAEIAANRPGVSIEEARNLAVAEYGIEGEITPLPSDRDLNYRIQAADRDAFVLKLASAVTSVERIRFEQDLLSRLDGKLDGVAVPQVVSTAGGQALFQTERGHHGYMVTWLTGRPMAEATPHTPELLRALGSVAARIDLALADLESIPPIVASPWDVMESDEVVDTFHDSIPDPDRRELIQHFNRCFDRLVRPVADDLPQQVVHNDLNDYNVLVAATAQGLNLSAILDVGDARRTARVVEPVIAAAYAALHWDDPIAAISEVAGGYNDLVPLTEDELEVFVPLTAMRLCASVCLSSYRQIEEPEDEYVAISQEKAWRTLEILRSHSLDLSHYRIRAACGVEPCPTSSAVTAWIRNHRSEFAPVCDHRLTPGTYTTLDLSVSSGVSSGAPYVLVPEPEATRQVASAMREAQVEAAIGRYDEVRLVYDNALFEAPSLEGPVQRTVHLGVDIFRPVGSEVYAPLDGEVYGLADNDQDLSYGPTIVLKHEPKDCPAFYTLYGHLQRRDLPQLEAGRRVERGATIGHIGRPSENGGWTPHLHFQIVVDMLDRISDFPGVCTYQDRPAWKSVSPRPYELLGIADSIENAPTTEPEDLRRDRERSLASVLSLSYDRPLTMLRGRGAYMFDHTGRRFLDCVNNVNHIGHCHPAVVEAVSSQMRVLNTNTRYLHPTIVEYARRLTARLPRRLSVCFFVNSGSEANDLALRLARAYTGREAVVVLDAAYHGHLTSLIRVSPYKFSGPGGRGPSEDVVVAALPDVFRGRFRGPEASNAYADAVQEALVQAERQGGAAAFICESLLSCGGQIELPRDYLEKVYSHTRDVGAVCIADEVQVGFGRVGSHFWGFETQRVVPDIVTMGKPIGNGHPLAAVVTTPEIAAAFDTGMEYFNTFGGNPVSCAAGLAVLETIKREQLQEHALEVGNYLKDRLRQLQEEYSLIGDVRGRGLFLGVELVTDPFKKSPAAAQAHYVINRARALGVLLSTDGPDHNVLKIKPPLPFSSGDADTLTGVLDRILGEDPVQI
jgi:4-aminobutyrate aminotransferase-like enzyme/Ser/Thr protein kinase RdoA (MazF antagonist)